jgi:hypothetical protein
MNTEKAEKLFTLMRQYGVEHFKSNEIEIKMSGQVPAKNNVPIRNEKKVLKTKSPPLQAAPPVENTIPHHVNEVAALLKLGDNDLVDRLFPEYGAS